ncbi:hypothetical protein PS655_03445 [Pseudomonas fluorescens]|uniref:Glycosyltransferase 2-like domain-containing protein n=2 Tax=Pseudomonas fluorescens TaxID=294 RepID=A0A5E6UC01_PSEFL|nr:hypothetical protein PS655_03445 [Pseudomonas fluorescens]
MSVLSQDMRDLELFVIDDGSVDGSEVTIAEIAAQDSRVNHIRTQINIGLPALTCFPAFKMSKGEFIAWQFDDCEWKRDLLSSLLEVARIHPASGMIYGQAQVNSERFTRILGQSFSQELLQQRNIIPNCSVLIRRQVFASVGWFDPSVILKRMCDYDMWVRIGTQYKIEFLEKVLAVEKGPSLPDSLGNSVTFIPSLANAYRKQDRTKYLNIKNFKAWTPFASCDWMDDVQREQLAQLVFEHFLRTGNHHDGISKVIGLLPARFEMVKGESSRPAERVLLWYVDRLNKMHQRRELEIQSYIDAKEKHIAEQLVYIERQCQLISDLERGKEEGHISIDRPRNDLSS